MKLDYLPSMSDDNTHIKIPSYEYKAIDRASKTAVIEQSLVIGAYDARSLTIFILA